jgi:hypothetical protein
MATEENPLAKLSRWLKEQSGPVSIHTVVKTGDRELIAAYILAAFRRAANHSAVDRFGQVMDTSAPVARPRSSNLILQLFDGLARIWGLSDRQQELLLGLREAGEVAQIRRLFAAEVPLEIMVRTAMLLDIFIAINAHLPEPARADAWMHSPNSAPPFGGRTAVELMAEPGLDGLRSVRAYLWSLL